MPVVRCLPCLSRTFHNIFLSLLEIPHTNDVFSFRKLSPKCVKVARPTLFGYIETREEFEFYVNELFSLLKKSKLQVKVHKVYPLEQAAQAHIDLEGRKTTGKPLLKP